MNDAGKSDVLVVGAGVIGLSIARALHKCGAGKVTILERGSPGRESSHAAAGMLAPQAEAETPDDFFRFCRASNELYPAFCAALLEETGIDPEFDDSGTLYLAFDESDLHELGRRYEWQSAAGLRVEHLSAEDTHKLEPFVSPDSLGSLYFPEDRQVENRRLLSSLLSYCEINGIEVISGAEVVTVSGLKGIADGVVCSDGRRFSAGSVVLATGAWTSFIKGAEPLQGIPLIKPIRGQMLSFRAAKQLFRHVIYSPRGYIVPRRYGRILAGATTEDAGFENKVTEDGMTLVLDHALEISPSLESLPIQERWSGLRPYAEAGHPVIGPVGGMERLFVAAGHYRNGILLAPLTAELLSKLIVNGEESMFVRQFSKGGTAKFKTV